jgi:hypothetical protein
MVPPRTRLTAQPHYAGSVLAISFNAGASSRSNTHTNTTPALERIQPSKRSAMLGVGANDAGLVGRDPDDAGIAAHKPPDPGQIQPTHQLMRAAAAAQAGACPDRSRAIPCKLRLVMAEVS